MNFLQTLFGGGDAIKAIGDTVDRLVTSDDERLARKNENEKAARDYQLAFEKLEAQSRTEQVEINKIEAASERLFVSGWRPAIGWVCCFAFAYSYVFEPIARFIAQVGFGYAGAFPVLDNSEIYPVLLGMLGLGTLRTWEKHKGVANR
jgi:hypothetical protein